MALQNIDTRLTGASPYAANLHPSKCAPGSRVHFGTPVPKARANLAQGAAKLAFLTGIAATVLLAWQGITLHVQQFSVRPDTVAPMATTVARWVHNWTTALKPAPAVPPVGFSAFAIESRMTASELIDRWTPIITQASQRFDIPARWIRAVVQTESAGRTMSSAVQPITSRAGAMGIMQLMPGTYGEMRVQYHLGSNPYDPHDNIFAGAAYLHWLYRKYGYPTMFAAYNDGPGHLGERLVRGGLLPAETRNYVSHIVTELGGSAAHVAGSRNTVAVFTRPNGTPVKIELARITSVRVPLPGEYSRDVHAVIATGDVRQAVREHYDAVKRAMLASGALGSPTGFASRDVHATRHTRRLAAAHRTRHRAPHNRLAEDKRINVRFGETVAASSRVHLHPLRVRRQG
ncbi:MAG: lytic transglycosylase domain-containing protein [Rhizomicrobium sp.]